MSASDDSTKAKPAPAKIGKGVKFLFGGTAGMAATIFVQPLDLVKNRMQMSVCWRRTANKSRNSPDSATTKDRSAWPQSRCSTEWGNSNVQPVPVPRKSAWFTLGTLLSEGGGAREHKTSLHALRAIVRNEGISGIYTGLSAGLLRQATYTTTRLGIYTTLFEKFSKDGKPPNFAMKALIGVTAGGIGAFVGTPAEVALIRMTSDGRLPPDQKRGYKNVVDALFRIVQEEGVLTLWRGCIPTVGRAMVVNAAQLASYSQAKQILINTGYFWDGLLLHFVASMISGLITTAASMPVDIAKTRIQNMKMIDGKPEYSGALDVLGKVIRKEGFFSLWKGFTPYYARLGPHTVLTFIFLEQMNKQYSKYVLGDSSASGGL